ncbi:MAG TPA: sulfur carrier protein ThiS, partial [Polyangia bacterium]|nr:sulfur carrier protein ThiS [Polyangia bacterium]
MNDLRITVNGEPRTLAAGTTVATLIAELGMDAARVAVERNQDVVPRRTWTEALLGDGDHLEIVAFVGGGSGEPPFGGGVAD